MKLFALIALLCAQASYSSDRVGNGGDVLYCLEPSGPKVYVLEEFEENRVIKIGDAKLTYLQKVEVLIERIKKDFPARYEFYLANFNAFKKNVILTKDPLSQVDDAYQSPHKYCVIKQAAYFSKDSSNVYFYTISLAAWNVLNNDQKAILIFHELLYTEAVALGYNSSFYIRKANRAAFTPGRFDPAFFDDQFIKSIKKVSKNINVSLDQLQNAYSERIAIYLLIGLDLSLIYPEETLKLKLLTLKKRFSSSAKVVFLVDELLRKIDG